MTQPTAHTTGRCEIIACKEPAADLVPAYNPPHLLPVPDMPMCARHAALAREAATRSGANTTD